MQVFQNNLVYLMEIQKTKRLKNALCKKTIRPIVMEQAITDLSNFHVLISENCLIS